MGRKNFASWNCSNLIGQQFGKLTVIKRVENTRFGKTQWLCKCICGKESVATAGGLKSGNSRSCGICYKIGNSFCKTHGKCKTQLFTVWSGMIQRCCNPNDKNYYNYGGRGITICPEWLDKGNGFMNFYNWSMANGYEERQGKEKLTIDRENNDLGYSPSNCRWATQKEQQNNRRNNHLITYDGQTLSITQWANKLNFCPETLSNRIINGWSIERALTTPIKKQKNNKLKEIN